MTRPADPLAGARPAPDDPAPEGTDRPSLRVPSRLDPTAWRAARSLGGAWGRHAAVGGHSWWTPLRWVLAMTLLTLLLGFAQKAPCATGYWDGSKQYTHFCYSDVVPLWSDERLDVGGVPYRDTTVEYPVLTGAFMWLTADLTRGVHVLDSHWSELVIFGALTALLLSLSGLVVAGATAQTARGRPYDAAIFALSPLLVFHAFSNWDLLAMALASAALWAWSRDRPVAAGVFIGLGTAAKLYPIFLLVPLLVLAMRTRRYAPALWAGAAAATAWLTVNLPIAMAYHDGWWAFYKFSTDRPAERSSAWAVLKTLADSGSNPSDSVYWVPPGAAVALAVVAGILVVVWIGLSAPRKPRLAQLAFLAVLAFLLTTKVWSPQYSLWLVPLLALARPRWRLALVWQFVEIAVWFVTLTLLLGLDPAQSAHGIGYGWLMLLIGIRDALLLSLAALIVRDIWRPERDVVRAGGVDDPGGGVFDGAHDYFSRDSGARDGHNTGEPDTSSSGLRASNLS
ncbi:MAG TPA: glycosyltransferase 87 family protein [Jatrophihabitans sp.]|uniref:glycosyltransferase family 87 protein n=1 Tax=Jatrophihabitans sp. TaxID=1932789 RepID=UPI002DFB90A1|nr:glycosyltransferase 87 family protein [Jatrophihabitans sp.]